jgi:ABC-type taurine transport system ATPase subunit
MTPANHSSRGTIFSLENLLPASAGNEALKFSIEIYRIESGTRETILHRSARKTSLASAFLTTKTS